MATEADYVRALELLTIPVDAPVLEGLGKDTTDVVDAARGWIGGANVVGTGVTSKSVAGRPVPGQLALVVYVREKLPASEISRAEMVPERVKIPGMNEAVRTDVVEIGTLRLEGNTTRVRPVVPGFSVGLADGETGTLGCLVARNGDPLLPLILSNSHVIADNGRAQPGATVVQPGKKDGGTGGDEIGKLIEAVPFDFHPGFNNLCDAAVASVDLTAGLESAVPDIGTPLLDAAVRLQPGMQIQKSGRSTSHTVGTIVDVHFRTFMVYPTPAGGTGSAGFRDQVLCTRYTDQGDSGALVCTMEGVAVGLHWAGSQSASIFSPIAFVLQQLDITLWSKPPDGPDDRPSTSPQSSDSGRLALALDQNAEDLAHLPGVQGIGLDVGSSAVVVFVEELAAAAGNIPAEVSAVDASGQAFTVQVIVREIGVIVPE